jgi:hypothetical protein
MTRLSDLRSARSVDGVAEPSRWRASTTPPRFAGDADFCAPLTEHEAGVETQIASLFARSLSMLDGAIAAVVAEPVSMLSEE